MTTVVTSSQNGYLKLVRRLHRKRGRDHERAFLVEGEDLVRAGLECGAAVRALLIDGERAPDIDPALMLCPTVHVAPELLAQVSELAHAPRIIGVFELPRPARLSDALRARRAPWLVLDAVADPGNVGTIIRTASAFQAGGVVLLPGCGDPWSGKAVRASMGAIFRIPVLRCDVDELWQAIVDDPIVACTALDASGDVDLWDAEISEGAIIVVGGEREGVSDQVRGFAKAVARIPQTAEVESVNAGVAASIALYEWHRRR